MQQLWSHLSKSSALVRKCRTREDGRSNWDTTRLARCNSLGNFQWFLSFDWMPEIVFFIISDFIIERHNWREIWLSYFYGVIVYNRSVKSFFALHSVDAKGNTVLHGSHNAARRFLDGINYVSESIVGVSAKPTKFVSSWVTDKIAPSYWIPNAQIKVLCCICWLTNHHGLCWLNSSMNRPSDD